MTLFSMEDNRETVSFDKLRDLISERMSSVVYCERNGRLYGMITMGDIAKAYRNGRKEVDINTNFTRLADREYARARKIFHARAVINVLPIVDDAGIITGDYLRWNDIALNKCMSGTRGDIDIIREKKIAFIKPCAMFQDKVEAYDQYYARLSECGAILIGISCNELLKYVDKTEYFLTVDEADKRAVETLYCLILHRNDLSGRIVTYHNYYNVVLRTKILRQIQKSGIYVLNLLFADNNNYKRLRRNIWKKFADVGVKVSEIMHPSMYEAFFHNLAEEDYMDDIFQMNFSVTNKNGLSMLKNCSQPYYNVSDGERKTVGQPQEYNKTIYFVGPCFIYGQYVEDKNTIESLLQKKIRNTGYDIRVVNCGSLGYSQNFESMWARILGIDMKKGDILVIYFQSTIFPKMDNLNLCRILKRNAVKADWMVDVPSHCNHKVNELYAEAIFERLLPVLADNVQEHKENTKYNKDYIKILYIDRYFSDFNPLRYEKIGSIVMNCNPFTYGHRYLVEDALKIVDFLLIFVVEEDKSVFSFDERFVMVCDGVADMKNVMVVPSGPFILTQTSFPEYFVKASDEDLTENVENDVTVFAERIAPPLNIKYRFAGQEPEDIVTNEYNIAMKKILPQYGIEFAEIPRKQIEGRYISGSKAREYLDSGNLEELKKLVPQSTLRILLCDETAGNRTKLLE